jgi:hypothetical protein
MLMISLHSGRILDLVTNCYEYQVLQKAFDCEEEVCFPIVSELLRGDPATTLVNKHASHVWSKVRVVFIFFASSILRHPLLLSPSFSPSGRLRPSTYLDPSLPSS